MASQSQPAKKVLRIGIIQDGKLVQERLIKAGESVTIGESAKYSMVIPCSPLYLPEFPLFVSMGGSYYLQFTEHVQGKVSLGGRAAAQGQKSPEVLPLEKLQSDPSVQHQGGVWRLALTEQDRGKIAIEKTALLFQFVPPPPPQAIQPLDVMDFRAQFVEEDDPIYFGFLGLWAALGVMFALVIWLVPPPAELTFADVEERFADILVPEDPPEPEEQPIVEGPGEKKKADEPKEAGSENKKPKSKTDRAKAREARKQALRSKIRLARIGTRGKSSGGTTSDHYASGVLSDIDAISGAELVEEGTPSGPRKGDTSTEDVRIGNLEVSGAGSTQGSEGPSINIQDYAVSAGSGEVDEVEGADSVQKMVSKRSGELQYCYEEQLRADPGLGGRVEVYWNIAEGRVTTVEISSNTTGNDQLGRCIQKKIKRWRFAADVNGPVTWPFVFRKK